MPKLVTEFDGKIGGLTKAINSAKMQLGGFAKNAASVGAGMAGFSGVESILGKIGGAIGKAANLSDAAANVGLTVEQYQKLGFAFRDVGLSAEDMDKSVATMNTKLGEAAGGNEAAVNALAKLGLTYEGIKNQSPAEQFETIAKAIAKLPSQAERAAAATDYFGKSGKKLDQLVMGFDAVMQKAEEAGNIIGGETADAADKLGDELAKLDDAFTALTANSGIIGFFSSVVNGMNSALQTIKQGTTALLEMEGKLRDAGAKDISNNAGYSGGFLGLISSGSDAWFGETEGAKITTGKATDAEIVQARRKEAEKAKIRKDAADNEAKMAAEAKEKLNAKSHAEDVKTADKAIGEADKALKESNDAAQKYRDQSADEDAKKNDAQLKYLTDMEREIDLQKLLNEGKSREAAIQEEINKAKDAGMSDEEAAMMGQLAGQKYDISQPAVKPMQTEFTDQLLRIGGSIGGGAASSPTKGIIDATKQNGTELSRIKEILAEQNRKWDAARQEDE